MKYEWTVAMSTGIEDIDNEHKTLILWVNRLTDAVEHGKAEAEVTHILSFLGTYARRHFAHEEECFLKHACPAAEANRRAHEEFAVHFTKLRDDCVSHGVTPARVAQLQQALGNWLANHIMKVDTALLPCVK